MVKAIALMSGGLDSTIAAKIIKDQGIDVLGVCFKSAFFGSKNAVRMAKTIDIPLKVIDFTEEHIKMVRNPKHGYGKNMNPCIDCHALMLKKAGELMENVGADFLLTGEVLNERPMSQNLQSLNIVKNESGYASKILRPLCAKNLPPTEMEKQGLVDRERLLDIKGRSRKAQMDLAKKLGINDYPSPAGGCKLTEIEFSRRLKDLLTYEKDFDLKDIEVLKIGRHFRISPLIKLISTRNADEYKSLESLQKEDDLIFDAVKYSGSTVILRGVPDEKGILLAAEIAARYSKGNMMDCVEVRYGLKNDQNFKIIDVKPASDKNIAAFML
ncbi:MAG TPA: tRNA 4-thiouridine(8) synthase ThiI [Clostridiaceae bacterium]|nr:tRNA 4-thiouridine(8) synthase ThiI [Clostridiaceae bacterium]